MKNRHRGTKKCRLMMRGGLARQSAKSPEWGTAEQETDKTRNAEIGRVGAQEIGTWKSTKKSVEEQEHNNYRKQQTEKRRCRQEKEVTEQKRRRRRDILGTQKTRRYVKQNIQSAQNDAQYS